MALNVLATLLPAHHFLPPFFFKAIAKFKIGHLAMHWAPPFAGGPV